MFTPAQSRIWSRKIQAAARLAAGLDRMCVGDSCWAGWRFQLQHDLSPSAGRPSLVGLTEFLLSWARRSLVDLDRALLLGIAIVRLPTSPRYAAPVMLRNARVAILFLAALVLVCGIIGTHVVFHGFSLPADEFLADFDATILRSGMAIVPVDLGMATLCFCSHDEVHGSDR